MRLFQRQPRPNYSTKIIAPEATKDPITPIPETLIQRVQICAHCGEQEATHPITIGWFYTGRLPFVGLCETCYAVAKQKEAQHHLSQKKTILEHPVASKPRLRKVTLSEQTERV